MHRQFSVAESQEVRIRKHTIDHLVQFLETEAQEEKNDSPKISQLVNDTAKSTSQLPGNLEPPLYFFSVNYFFTVITHRFASTTSCGSVVKALDPRFEDLDLSPGVDTF